jgi:hypothetical protein
MSRARDLADLGGSADAGGLTGRNLIINGAFQCWQRSTSVSSQTGSGYKTADRWYTNASGGTYNQSQQTVTLGDSTIGDFKYFLRHEVTTGDDFTGILYRIEDVQSVPEGTVTLSFYAKGTNPNSGHFEMIARQDFGTGGSPSSDVIQTAQDVTLTSSWQRFELQITVPSISGKTLGTNGDSYYQLQFTQPSDDDSSDAWTLDITGVQLEVGQTATPFEHRSFGDELARCLRYYEEWGGEDAYQPFGYFEAASSDLGYLVLHFSEKRDGPTVTVSNASHFHTTRSAIVPTSFSFSQPATTHVFCTIAKVGGFASGQIYSWRANNSTAARIYFNAEL